MNSDPAELPEGWEWRNQDDVFKFSGGAQPPASTFVSAPRPGYVRLIQIRDYASDSNETYVPDSSRLRKCNADDVMIARYGFSVGRICRGLEGAYNVALVKTTPLVGVSREYLFYLLKSDYFQLPLHGQAGRSVQAGFNKDGLRRVQLPAPPLAEQRRIAGVLGALDEKIENCSKLARRLDLVLETLFREEFAVPYEQGRLRDTWTVETVGTRLDTHLGGTPSRQRSEYWESGSVAWINSGKANDFRVLGASEFITEEAVAKSATKLLPRGTTIVAITGTTMGQVSRIEIEACTNQSLVGILGSSELPDEFVYYWVRSLVSQLVRRQTGAAQQHVNKGDIKSLPLLVPDSASVADYMRVAEPAMRFISEQLFTARRLAELRDILLPKLISGQLRVPESYNPDGLHGEAEAGEREGVGLSL